MTVYSGTQKISMGRNDDTDYKSKRAAAVAQAGQNQYIQGVQEGIAGIGDAVAAGRTVYGNSNISLGGIINKNFAYTDSPGNQPLADRENRTGSVDTQVSSTNVPQQDPSEMETDALSNRLEMMAKGGQGFPGLNDRSYGA